MKKAPKTPQQIAFEKIWALVRAYGDAQTDHSWAGSCDPEERDQIEIEFVAAHAKVRQALAKLCNYELKGVK